MRTVIKNGMVISMDLSKDRYVYEDVVIEDDKILYVGCDYDGDYDKMIDATGKIVMPGLINCHTHLGMSLFRATNDNYGLDRWLKEYIWPIENRMTDNDVYYTTLLSIVEMIKTGTTTFNDMYFSWRGSFRAFNEIGIRGVYGRCLMGDMDKDGIGIMNDFKELCHNNDNEMIGLSIAPHALYTTSMDYLKECERLATDYDLPIHIHLSENMREVREVTCKFGKSPIEVIKDAGFFNHRVILAHGTFVSDDELDLIRDKEVSICTNPVSNLNLGCGIADIKKYIDNGVNVCLGTDGVGSGNNMNMFYHMSLLDNLQKAKYENSCVMDSYEVLKIATINGARALGLENDIGSIEVGKKADIIIVDLSDITMWPCVDPIIQLVHNGWYDSVDTTIIDGVIIMENKKLFVDIDLNDLKNKISLIRERLM